MIPSPSENGWLPGWILFPCHRPLNLPGARWWRSLWSNQRSEIDGEAKDADVWTLGTCSNGCANGWYPEFSEFPEFVPVLTQCNFEVRTNLGRGAVHVGPSCIESCLERMCVNLSSYNYLGFGGVDEWGSLGNVMVRVRVRVMSHESCLRLWFLLDGSEIIMIDGIFQQTESVMYEASSFRWFQKQHQTCPALGFTWFHHVESTFPNFQHFLNHQTVSSSSCGTSFSGQVLHASRSKGGEGAWLVELWNPLGAKGQREVMSFRPRLNWGLEDVGG